MRRDKAELDRALSPWSPQSKREDSVMHAVTQRQAQKGDGCEEGGPHLGLPRTEGFTRR